MLCSNSSVVAAVMSSDAPAPTCPLCASAGGSRRCPSDDSAVTLPLAVHFTQRYKGVCVVGELLSLPTRGKRSGAVLKLLPTPHNHPDLAGRTFASPSGASDVVCGYQTNGWKMWVYETAAGNWASLGRVRDQDVTVRVRATASEALLRARCLEKPDWSVLRGRTRYTSQWTPPRGHTLTVRSGRPRKRARVEATPHAVRPEWHDIVRVDNAIARHAAVWYVCRLPCASLVMVPEQAADAVLAGKAGYRECCSAVAEHARSSANGKIT